MTIGDSGVGADRWVNRTWLSGPRVAASATRESGSLFVPLRVALPGSGARGRGALETSATARIGDGVRRRTGVSGPRGRGAMGVDPLAPRGVANRRPGENVARAGGGTGPRASARARADAPPHADTEPQPSPCA